MSAKPEESGSPNHPDGQARLLVSASGALVLPLLGIVYWLHPASTRVMILVVLLAIVLAPLPALLYARRRQNRLIACATHAREEAAQLKLQLETVRYRTSRLRVELQAAHRQARLSHQLTLLGQFTAGFMHEFNNPLAIVAGRIGGLVGEREGE